MTMETLNNKNLFEIKLNELRANKEKIYALMKEQAFDPETIAYYEQQAEEFGEVDIEILSEDELNPSIKAYYDQLSPFDLMVEKKYYEFSLKQFNELYPLLTVQTRLNDELIDKLISKAEVLGQYEEYFFHLKDFRTPILKEKIKYPKLSDHFAGFVLFWGCKDDNLDLFRTNDRYFLIIQTLKKVFPDGKTLDLLEQLFSIEEIKFYAEGCTEIRGNENIEMLCKRYDMQADQFPYYIENIENF